MILLMTMLCLALLLKHYIADVPLQTNWMALNKGTFLHPGGLAHAAIHAIGTLLVLFGFQLSGWMKLPLLWLLGLALLEFVIHYAIDWAKMNLDRRLNYSRLVYDDQGALQGRLITNIYYYWLLVGDQCLHFATYILLAAATLSVAG